MHIYRFMQRQWGGDGGPISAEFQRVWRNSFIREYTRQFQTTTELADQEFDRLALIMMRMQEQRMQ